MFVKLLRGFTAVAVIILFAAWAWKYFGTGQANNLVQEANALEVEAVGIVNQAPPKFTELTSDAAVDAFPGNRAQLEPLVRELTDLYTRTAEKYRAAGAKLDEASKQPVDAIVAEYFVLQSQHFVKKAETYEGLREYVGVFIDPKIETLEPLKSKLAEIDKRVSETVAADGAITAKADKIKAEYPDKLQ